MGCGCGSKKTKSETVERSKFFDSTAKKVESVENTRKPVGCMQKYNSLHIVRKQAVDLYNKFKNSDNGSLEEYKNAKDKMDSWIRNLKNDCPDEKELAIVKAFIETDYYEYFSKRT